MNNVPLIPTHSERSERTTSDLRSTPDYLKNESESMTKHWTHAELGLPVRFQLLGHTIEVVIENVSDVGKVGDSDFDLDLIRLFPTGCCRDVVLHTYWHEVTHFLLHYSGRPDLSEDEVLVDTLGGLLAQVVADHGLHPSSTTDTD